MRDPLSLCAPLHSNDFSSLVSLSSLVQEQLPGPSLYDMSMGSWGPLHRGSWSPARAPTTTMEKQTQPWSPDLGVSADDQTVPKGKSTRKTPRGGKKGKTKKNYQRYAKPPYSYLAMIALAIQNSPDKMLKLSQIIKQIESLFPFFKGDYIGWKDSVRHNLSSSDCFKKVLKDPGKPQAKGNFWTVDVTRIPQDAMKLQNTVMARGGPEMFVQDLSPYILHNYKYEGGGYTYQQMPGSNYSTASSASLPDDPHQVTTAGKLTTSFMIDSLLHDLQDVDLPDVARSIDGLKRSPTPCTNTAWPPAPLSSSHSYDSSRSGYSSSSASLSTISPVSCDENPERCRDALRPGVSIKRPREEERSGTDSDDERCSPLQPPGKTPFHPSDLPTSYTKCVPPNVVAPPNVLPFFPFPRLTYYNYGPAPYMSPPYWGLLPQPTSPTHKTPQPPPLDLDTMLRAVPPNKSVFDVLTSHPGDLVHPAFLSQCLASSLSPGQDLL